MTSSDLKFKFGLNSNPRVPPLDIFFFITSRSLSKRILTLKTKFQYCYCESLEIFSIPTSSFPWRPKIYFSMHDTVAPVLHNFWMDFQNSFGLQFMKFYCSSLHLHNCKPHTVEPHAILLTCFYFLLQLMWLHYINSTSIRCTYVCLSYIKTWGKEE